MNEAQLYFESEIYDVSSIIDLSIILNLSNEILDYDLVCTGFEIVKDLKVKEDIITFSVKYTINEEKPHLEFTLNLTDNVNLSMSLYGLLKEDKIFISRSSFKDAEEVYLDYLQENDIDEYERIRSEEMVCNDPIKPSNLMKLPSASPLASNPNTYVQGTFRWFDDDENPHPLQFNRVELWDKEPIGETLLDVTYTDENGFYRFEFVNADKTGDFENSGYDVFVRVLPMGENTRVYKGNGKSYQKDLGYYYPNIPTGTVWNVPYDFYMKEGKSNEIDWNNHDYTFAQALQISQAVIFASKYVKEMNGENIASVSVKYPHNEKKSTCYYGIDEKTIYILNSKNFKTYAAWDPIMHEYGHHVQYQFDISDNPGGTHWVGRRMGDHYKSHYKGVDGTNCECSWQYFPESECKLQGNKLAWAEGWATYFGTVAQQYFIANLSNIKTVGDSSYSDSGTSRSLTNEIRLSEDCEGTVQSILYEMYDNSSDDAERDSLALGHKVMWDLTTGSKATTFQEFDIYFRNNITNRSVLKYYGRILGNYFLAASIAKASSVSTVTPNFTWSWKILEPSRYFNHTSFELNFYDINYNIIGKSDKTSANLISISDELWIRVINSGNMFYVSVTRYEQDSSYEGEWRLYSTPSPIEMSFSSKFTRELGTGECYWFSFTAPQNGTFIFETTGNMDTYGELFYQMVIGRTSDNRISYDNDSGEDQNFKISYSMNKGDVILLRVRGNNWVSKGEFTISISSLEHVHEYTYSYTSLNDRYHISKCSCGETIQEGHYFITEKLGNRCKYCGYFTKGLVPVPFPTLQVCDIDSIIKKEDNF
ncbi:MAG: hypothetical protein K2J85_00110 [Anaeroplasmataceae bacterium]|nr:hypothetical protein [Anaeroplasmataceae bacterium]